jgi:hypothetical protein
MRPSLVAHEYSCAAPIPYQSAAAAVFSLAMRARCRNNRPRGHVVKGLSGHWLQTHGSVIGSLRRAAAAISALRRDDAAFAAVFLLPIALM